MLAGSRKASHARKAPQFLGATLMKIEKNHIYSNNLTPPPLVLASVSPRRRQLLESLGLPFNLVAPVGVVEKEPAAHEITETVSENALAKATSILAGLPSSAIAIGADTLVLMGEQVLGKPNDRTEALEHLRKLSGKTHRVLTGMALLSKHFGRRISLTESRVTFRDILPDEMEVYADLEEPYDKAGAYAAQGVSALFIQKIEGSYTNVLGLPIETLLSELGILTARSPFTWFPLHRHG